MSAVAAGCAAIITAAGSGNRLGAGIPKALVPLAGIPLVTYAAASMALAGISDIVITAPAQDIRAVTDCLDDTSLRAAAAKAWPRAAAPGRVALRVVAGGASRQASVAAGLDAITAASPHGGCATCPEVVIVHDAARALTPPDMILRVLGAVSADEPAVIPGLVPADTLKRVDERHRVTATVSRSELRAIQTPQAFRTDLLMRAHAAGAPRAADEKLAATDDAGLVEALGISVLVVAGDEAARKVTTSEDLAALEALLREPEGGVFDDGGPTRASSSH